MGLPNTYKLDENAMKTKKKRNILKIITMIMVIKPHDISTNKNSLENRTRKIPVLDHFILSYKIYISIDEISDKIR